MSTEVERYFETKKQGMTEELNTCALAEIISVELEYMRADIKLLIPEETIIMQVPIAPMQTGDFIIRMPYKAGDKVVVTFSQTDNDPVLFGGGESSRRQHALDDAVIIGGIMPFLQPLSAEFAEYESDLIIAKRDSTSKIVLKESGEILIEALENISINSQKDITITAGGIITTTDSRGGA